MNTLLTSLFAAVVACATFSVNAQAIKGDAKAGASKNSACIGCHGIAGYQASFPEIYKVPKISGQNAEYIVAALNGYKTGARKHPTMRAMAETLSDQDMADLAAYYSTHGQSDAAKPAAPQPSAAVAGLLQKGACASCHGADFDTPITPAYPKLAGQHADALFVALKAYKTESNATWGRSGTMVPMAQQFSNSELKAIANYLGSLPGDLKTIPEAKFR